MTFDEWGEVLRIAATIWPHSQRFFDDPPNAERTPTRTWWAALCQFETSDVLSAVGRLGMTSRYWPSLAEVVEASREALAERMEQRRRTEQPGRARLLAPRQCTVAERLAVFDHTAAAVRRERSDELGRFASRRTVEAHRHLVDIVVNTKPVRIEGPSATGLQIKQAAIAQGVLIQLSFQLSEKVGPHKTRVVGDTDTVSLHEGAVFVAVAEDDNS